MSRRPAPTATLQAQLVAVRRAASTAALACRPDSRPNVSLQSKQEANRDALAAAAMTLAAVQSSREALDMMPDAQREKLAISLAAGGYRAVRVEDPADPPGMLVIDMPSRAEVHAALTAAREMAAR